MLLQDISIYFGIKRSATNHGIVSPLVETMPKLQDNLLNKLSKLPVEEFTITFNLQKLKFASNCENLNCILYKLVYDLFRKWIKNNLSKQKDYIIYMIPEFHKSGIIHFHAIAYFDNANDYYINKLKILLNRKCGRTEGKKIYKLDNWYKYIHKEYKPENFYKKMVFSKGEFSPKETK